MTGVSPHPPCPDFQNIAQNGARADDVAKKLMYTMHRNQTDYPALVFHALIGNDVCNGRLQPDGSIGGFTKVEDFEAAVLKVGSRPVQISGLPLHRGVACPYFKNGVGVISRRLCLTWMITWLLVHQLSLLDWQMEG